ncbi:MAG: deoxyribose-phosphate aldolase [Saccharofermentanales bacterium]
MDIGRILAAVDYTLLSQTATTDEIIKLCDDAIYYKTASVCIPPFYVKVAKDHCMERMAVCTVIGFPNGYQTTAAKLYETIDALANGADEIDMVIPIGALKDRRDDLILDEIRQIKAACGGKILKVIIETALLTDEEKVRMCHIITEAKADFIKTSTGFSTGGATIEDIILFRKHIGPDVKIKAAGGIKTLEAAEEFLDNGVSRLGSSAIIKIIKQMRIPE